MSTLTNRSTLEDASAPPVSLSGQQSQDRPVHALPGRAVAPATTQPKPRMARTTAALCGLAFVLVLYNGLNLLIMIELTPKNDFGRTFLSAVAFVHGEDMYGMNESIPWKLKDGSLIDLWNLNPPHFHLLLLPLAWLPIRAALVLWLLANAVCGYDALRRIVGETQLTLTPAQRQLVLLGLLGFIGTTSALVTGHLSLLLFWLVTLSWQAGRRERWTVSAIWLGLALSIKPFLLFLAPYYLRRRQWRAVAALAAVVLLCVAAGLIAFGWTNHVRWWQVVRGANHWAWLPMNASIEAFLSRTFMANPIFTPLTNLAPRLTHTIWLSIGIPMGVLTYAAAFGDSSRRGVDRAFALLTAGALLLSPLGWTYYFWLAVGPMTALLANGRRGTPSGSGFSPWTLRLLRFSLFGLMYPLWIVDFLQPLPLGTVLIGSLYFWSLLLVWLALLIDGWRFSSLAAKRRIV